MLFNSPSKNDHGWFVFVPDFISKSGKGGYLHKDGSIQGSTYDDESKRRYSGYFNSELDAYKGIFKNQNA